MRMLIVIVGWKKCKRKKRIAGIEIVSRSVIQPKAEVVGRETGGSMLRKNRVCCFGWLY